MSMTARHENRKAKQACQRCRDRKARFQYRGHVRADRDHTLCFECYRSERERMRAQRLTDVRPVPIRAPFPGDLTERQVQHRLAMLAFAREVAGDRASCRTLVRVPDPASEGSSASAARTLG
jgi:hypothetical protein